MSKCRILDTFPEFQTFWAKARHQSIEKQIEGWAKTYMAPWPELLNKQLDDYADEGEDWRQIARERVFPFLSARLPAMETAHANLVKECARVYARAGQALGFESAVVFVIYVGIGCGAGWATTFEETPAILFGLENVAECGWSEPLALTGLIAHEIGHLAHFHWRQAHNVPKGTGPWWQLYTEGFAQRCEHLIMGQESWHMRETQEDDDWLEWCRERQSWLAEKFLRAADAGESVRPFFGSWYDIEGHSQSGYFLGHELIRVLEVYLGMREIALLDSEDPRLRASLEKLAGNGE